MTNGYGIEERDTVHVNYRSQLYQVFIFSTIVSFDRAEILKPVLAAYATEEVVQHAMH